jgi:hypothetical protein
VTLFDYFLFVVGNVVQNKEGVHSDKALHEDWMRAHCRKPPQPQAMPQACLLFQQNWSLHAARQLLCSILCHLQQMGLQE